MMRTASFFLRTPFSTRLIRTGIPLLLLMSGCGESKARKQPVVVLITLDTTRADHLGCYGYSKTGISPRIDELAAGGTLFESAIAQAAVTPVSHASILTGKNPYNHGLRVLHGTSQNQLGPEQVTLAEVLRDVGYSTGAFVSAFPATEYFGLGQGFQTFDSDFTPDDVQQTNIKGGMVSTGTVQRRAGKTTSLALKWMEAQEQPFCLWLHYFDPHDDRVIPPARVMAEEQFLGTERENRLQLYDVEIAYMDRMIGRVFDKLKDMGLWDDAIVILTADHGEGLGDHDWWTHGVLYQEQIRVPLLIRAPGQPEGSRVAGLVRTIDILPTLGGLLGLSAHELPPMDGVSLEPLMSGEVADMQLVAYSDSVNISVYNTSESIRDDKLDQLFALVLDGRWKYIHHLKEPSQSELYDLKLDPGELTNRLSDEPEQVARALAELQRLDFMPVEQGEQAAMPAHVKEQLRELGYAGADDEDEGQ